MLNKDEIISADAIVKAPRGRKVELDDQLVAIFGKLSDGQAARLGKRFGVVAKDDRPKVSATIRKNAAHVHPDRKVRVNFGTEGVPQVSFAPVGATADEADEADEATE